MEPFSKKLRWSLLAVYALIAGAGLIVGIGRRFDPHFFTGSAEILIGIGLMVQLVAVIVALSLLIRDVRYRSVPNILTTLAGAFPLLMFVVAVMSGNVRVHM